MSSSSSSCSTTTPTTTTSSSTHAVVVPSNTDPTTVPSDQSSSSSTLSSTRSTNRSLPVVDNQEEVTSNTTTPLRTLRAFHTHPSELFNAHHDDTLWALFAEIHQFLEDHFLPTRQFRYADFVQRILLSSHSRTTINVDDLHDRLCEIGGSNVYNLNKHELTAFVVETILQYRRQRRG